MSKHLINPSVLLFMEIIYGHYVIILDYTTTKAIPSEPSWS